MDLGAIDCWWIDCARRKSYQRQCVVPSSLDRTRTARVSTLGQDYSGQIEALKAAGATTIYREKVSGARAVRPQLAKLMASLKAGDTVVVTKLDRLGRTR
jgi:hypothetical protein